MSRSIRLPIIKDRPRNFKKSTMYWRRVRRVSNTQLKSQLQHRDYDDIVIRDRHTIVNQYDYCDYIFDGRYQKWDKSDIKKWSRK